MNHRAITHHGKFSRPSEALTEASQKGPCNVLGYGILYTVIMRDSQSIKMTTGLDEQIVTDSH